MPTKEYRNTHLEQCRKKEKRYDEKHRGERRTYKLSHYRRVKKETFALLGNKCTNPYNLEHGVFLNDKRCLQIDHVHGRGNRDRKEKLGSTKYYRLILDEIKAGSKDYQLLCANCNIIKKFEEHELNQYTYRGKNL